MYFDFLVKIPEIKGKITFKTKGNSEYVSYEKGRTYDKEKKYNIPQRVIIGKRSRADKSMMMPNENFKKYFPEVELPEEKYDSQRSSCLRIGAYVVIKKLLKECKIPEILGQFFQKKDLSLFLDLVAYTLICENNAGQYYPDYAYNHPLFTEKMKVYSDSKVSSFLASITDDHSVGFLNAWNEGRDHREKIYISYDSTNKNCQAGDIEMVEYGKPKVDMGKPIFNYSIAYDTYNREPLFYEEYPGSINDVSQLQCMLDKAKGYGYRHVGFILDRGYFSRNNIEFMDACGYEFVIMVKGMATFVRDLILRNKGQFEEKRACYIRNHQVYGTTIKAKLYVTDEKDRYFHLFHSVGKEHGEKDEIERKINNMEAKLKKYYRTKYEPTDYVRKYFNCEINKDGVFVFAKENHETVEKEMKLCGYFVIVTSQKMTAKEAIDLYYSRDSSEKLFRGDKSYLGNKSLRVHSSESASAKIFVEFVALIVRNRLYTKLKDETEKLDNRPNYMTVPAAIKELEKIEMVRGADRVYRLDHAVTATQKTILNAFGIDANYIKKKSDEIADKLQPGK